MNVDWIAEQFDIFGKIKSVAPFGDGHINDTYHVQMTGLNEPSYLLQKINTFVFKNIETLTRNIFVVTSHLRDKLIQSNCIDIDKLSIEVVACKDGKLYFFDTYKKHYWRMFNFITNHKVYNDTSNPNIVFESGKMFGAFLFSLSDLKPSLIHETIPHFHNIQKRFQQLELEISADRAGRLKYVKDDILYVKSNLATMSSIYNLAISGLIPMRITHNDTKINNVLFDENDKGLCVVDLDTVMPGYVHYDYGDGLRTSANIGKEDDEDLKNVGYNLRLFTAFTDGYIQSTRNILNDVEVKTLADSAILLPFMMGVRFLTDYLTGDVYYKTNFSDHNLIRAKAQFKLAQDGTLKLEELNRIIKNFT